MKNFNEVLALKIRQLSDTQVVYQYYLGSFINYSDLLEKFPIADEGSLAQVRDTDTLYYFDGTNWVTFSSGSGATTLTALTDTSITSPSVNQILLWNGSIWINSALPEHTLDSHSDVNTSGVTSGQFLKYNGIQWVPATASTPTELSDLSDVDTTGVANGNVLIFNSTSGEWEPSAPANPNVLSDLSDVSATAPTSSQVLTWNGTAWAPATPATPATNLDGLTDVTITSVASGNIIKYNGTAWVNVSLANELLGGDYKGSYADTTALSSAYPSPTGNNWALVAGIIYINNGGNWESTLYEIYAVDSSTETELETLSNFDTNNEYTGSSIIADDLIVGKRHKHSSVEGVDFEVLEDGTWHRNDRRMPRESLGALLTPVNTDATASTSVKLLSIPVPCNMKLIDFIGACQVAPVGSTAIFDIHYEATPAGGTGTTIFSTKPTIDASEFVTTTAATASVISTVTLAKGGMLHFYVDQVGSTTAGQGYSAFLNFYRID